MVRANGSYPLCPGFNSLHRHHPILRKFRKGLKELPVGNGDKVLLAYSGGGDSAGMLALFLSALPRPDIAIGLCHIDHNLRGAESDRDVAACSAIAEKLSLPLYVMNVNEAPPRGKSLEEWAREQRYGLLERARKRGKWDFVATAHSMDDQAETLLMRIARGTGIEGLRGILKVSSRVIRPCLDIRASDLRAAAAECGIPYVEDSSNKDPKFLRNRLRNEAMPVLEKALPGIVGGLLSLSLIAGSEADDHPAIAKADGNSLYYSLSSLAPLGSSEALAAFRLGLRAMNGGLRGFGRRHYEAVTALVRAPKGAWVPLPGGLMAEREEKGVRLKRRKREALR